MEEREGNFVLHLRIHKGEKPMLELKEGHWRQGLQQKLWKDAAFSVACSA